MNFRIKKIIISCLFLFPLYGNGQELTLEECQKLALENYPLIAKYDLINQTVDFSLSKIMTGYLPQIGLLAQVTYQSDVAALPDPLVKMLKMQGLEYLGMDKTQYRVALNVEQVLWDGNNIHSQKNVAKAQGEFQKAQTDVDLYKLKDRVNNLFFGILLLEEKIALLDDVQTLLQSNCDKVEKLAKGGVTPKSNLHKLQAEMLAVQQQADQLATNKRTCQAVLATMVGKKPEDLENLVKPDAISVTPDESNQPEIKMFNAQLRVFDCQAKLVNTSVYPRLSLFATGFYGYPGYDMFNSMFDHDAVLNGIVGVKLMWNISNFYTLRNNKSNINIGRKMVENGRETFLFNNGLQQTQQYQQILQYQSMLEKDEEIIALRKSIRQSTENQLEGGIIDVNTLLQEITKENQARNDKSSHEIEMLKKMYELQNTTNK